MAAHRSHRARSPRRLRRVIAAAVLAGPLVAAPVLVPAAASAVDSPYAYGQGYGSYGGYSQGYGSYGAYGSYGGYGQADPYSDYGQNYGQSSTTTIDAEPASTTESTGVVLVDTVLDYGEGEAAGTGLVLSDDGIVITNHHVVQGSTSVTVTIPSTGKTYQADVIGYDATHDVAVLQLQGASGLTTVTSDTSAVTDGESVTAVGNAEGGGSLVAADGTVTDPSKAITVTEDDGSTQRLTDLIETSADVVSGDSGGALLNADGEVVGMNVAATSGGTEIDGYAIPIDTVLDIATKILNGDTSGDITLGYGAALGVQLYGSTPLVAGVVDGGAADDAGITAGSTITSLDGTAVSTSDELVQALAGHSAGDRVSVGWTDSSGDSHTATVTLGRAPVA